MLVKLMYRFPVAFDCLLFGHFLYDKLVVGILLIHTNWLAALVLQFVCIIPLIAQLDSEYQFFMEWCAWGKRHSRHFNKFHNLCLTYEFEHTGQGNVYCIHGIKGIAEG